MYSHVSGASLHELQLWKVDDRVHLTQNGCPSGISHGRDVVAHTKRVTSREMCFVDGLPCTSLERTVVDCCLMFTVPQAVILIDHAARLGADLGIDPRPVWFPRRAQRSGRAAPGPRVG